MGDTTTIGIRELRDRASDVVRSVRESRARYVVTLHGRPVAVLKPVEAEDLDSLESSALAAEVDAWDALADEVTAAWKSPKTGVELVSEQRR